MSHDSLMNSLQSRSQKCIAALLVLTLGWQSKQGVDIKASVAQRLGDNPAPQSNGSDNDGTLRLNRAWLMASFAF